MTIKRSSPVLAQVVLAASLLALLLLAAGALGTRYDYWSYRVGFMLITTAVMLAAIAFFGGLLVAFIVSRSRASGGWMLALGLLLALAPLVLIGYQVWQARTLPPIHDITTDPDDPPQFERALELRGADANPLDYDARELAPLQRDAYPDVVPLEAELPPEQSYQRSLEVLRGMGLEIVAEDPQQGRIEAVATTKWFGFKDDLVVRIRPDGAGSRIDLRSVSRVGRSDLGANAARIRAFIERFRAND